MTISACAPAPRRTGARARGFVSKVLKQAGKASSGKSTVRRPASAHGTGQRPGSRLGRGHGSSIRRGGLTPMSRRVTIKTLLVNHQRASPQSLAKHLRYIERDGVGRDGEPGQATGRRPIPPTSTPSRNAAPTTGTISASSSPEMARNWKTCAPTRHLMGRMEADLGTGLDWVAVNHWNTDNPIPT